MEIDKSFILWTLAGIVTLVIIAVKATVYKITSPLKDRVSELETKMTLFEQSHDTIIELLEKIDRSQSKIPEQIDEKIKSREEFFDLKYVKKEQ